MEKFNVETEFANNTQYIFDKKCADIFMNQAVPASENKYFSVCLPKTGGKKEPSLPTAFYLKDLNNVTLDFNGAMIILHGLIQPFIIDNCTNITIKNVTVAYNRANYTELDIVDHIGNELWCVPKEKFPCRTENGYFIPYSDEWEDRNVHSNGCLFMQAYDKKTRDGAGMAVIYLGEKIVKEATPPVENIPHIKVRGENEKIIFSGEIPEEWNSSHSIVLEHGDRRISSAAIFHSKNTTFENYRILNGIGMGLFAVMCDDITIKNYKLTHDSLSHGFVSNSADGIHFVATRGKINISDSVFEGTIDDALNIHSNFYYANSASGNLINAVRSSKSCGMDAYADVFREGDAIAVYRGDTMEVKKEFNLLRRSITGDWTVDLAVDSDASDISEGDLIENLSTNAEIYIENCIFAKSNAHLRFQSRGKTILKNCEFTMPILLTGDTNYWYESSPVRDMTIENCNFKGTRAVIRVIPEFTPTVKEPFYHGKIKILNCRFDDKHAVYANYAESIIIESTITSGGKAVPEAANCGTVEVI